jgi:hypothetical protein
MCETFVIFINFEISITAFFFFQKQKKKKMSDLFSLTGKVAAITGCTKGIGFGMTMALAQAGAGKRERESERKMMQIF